MAGEWREIALWDIAEYINGRATKPSELASNGVPVIKIAELNRGITEETDRIPPELVQEKHWVSHGDLLFAWSGSVGIYRYTGSKAALNQHIFRVVGKPGIDQGFLRYLLLSCMPVFHLHVQDKRTTMGHVTKQDLQRIKVRVPPLQEQRAIAHILGTLDDKIELNRRMSQTLEAMAQALFKAWFVDFEPVRAKLAGRWQRGQSLPGLPAHLYDLFPDRLVDSELGQIPEGWEVKSLDEIARFLNGLALQKYPPTGNCSLPVIKIAQLRAGHTNGADRASADIAPEYVVNDGDILFSWSGSLECVVWAGGKGALNQHLFKVLPNGYPRWLCYFGIHEHLEDFRHIAASKATTMGHIQRHHLSSAKLAVPSLDLLSVIDRYIFSFFEASWKQNLESRTLAGLRDALLPKLIRGEMRVKDAERFLKERGL